MKTLLSTTAAALILANVAAAEDDYSEMSISEQSEYATDLAQSDIAEDADTEVEEMTADAGALETDTGLEDAPMSGTEYATLNSEDLTTDDLMGVTVYSAMDENVGEIDDLLITEDGVIEAAIIDVGGFLGLGEKSVEIAFDTIMIEQTSDDDDDLRVSVAMTQEELEALPEIDD